MKNLILPFVLFAFLSITCYSQLTFSTFTNLNDVKCQLEVGDNIWFGGQGGISVRNKSTGGIVATHTSNNGLANNNIKDMAKDLAGNIYVVTEYGMSKFNGQTWYNYHNKNTNIMLDIWVNLQCIIIDYTGTIWLGTNGYGLIQYDGSEWTIHNSANTNIAINDTINDMAVNNNGDLWLATNNYGYIMVDDRFFWVNDFERPKLNKVVIDQNDSVWVDYVQGMGITRYHPQGSPKSKLLLDIGPADKAARTISVDAVGKIWVGTQNDGIYVIEGGISVDHYLAGDGLLIAPRVFAITPDAQGNIWAGTPDGISKFDGDATWTNYVNNNTLSGNSIRDIVINSGNMMFFATEFGLTKKSGPTWYKYLQPTIAHNDVVCLELVHDSILWIGTAGGAQFINIKSMFFGPPILGANRVNDILFVEPNTVYFGTEIGLMKKQGAGPLEFFDNGDGLVNNTVTSLNIDKDNNIWIGTIGGISKFDGTDFIEDLTEGNGKLPTNKVMDIVFDTTGNTWLATDVGVVVLDGSPYTIYDVTNSGLLTNHITKIRIDDIGMVWVGTDQGLHIFNGKRWANYGLKDGLTSNIIQSIYQPAGKTQKWTGTKNGAVKITYESPQANFTSDTICYSPANQLSNLTNKCSKIDSTALFQWDVNNDGLSDYDSWNVNHNFGIYGNYKVRLIVQSYYRYDTIIKHVLVGSEPAVNIVPGVSSVCQGDNQWLHANILNHDSIFYYNFQWSTGETTPGIKVNTDSTYFVTVTNFTCKGEDSSQVGIIRPFDEASICMVSVDSATGKNLVIWEKTENKGIASYNVYKLFGTSYYPIGNVPYGELTVFEDYSSTPEANAARYAITVIDTCGNESDFSPYHQTIHLGASKGTMDNQVILDWTPYEDQSGIFEPSFYYIYRGSSPDSLLLWDSISSAFTEKNDNNAQGAIYYRVAVKKAAPCDPAGLLKASAGPFSQAISNLEDNRLKESDVNEPTAGLSSVAIYPNPFKENTQIEYHVPVQTNVRIEVISMVGNTTEILSDEPKSIGTHTITYTAPNPGVYYIKITTGKGVTVKKVVAL